MLKLFCGNTPNSIKVAILLEELGVAYDLHLINVRAGEQKSAAFVALNPNAKVPVIVEPEGPDGNPLTLTESAAILIYLAEKHERYFPAYGLARARCLEWLFFQGAGLGPMFGQSGYFLKLAPEQPAFAVERYLGEAKRHLQVLDGRMAQVVWLAGDYSIADMATFGWIWRRDFAGVDLAETPHVARWYAAMENRPAVQSAMRKLAA